MQIQCQHCHKPYAMNKEALHQALDQITEFDQGHFNSHCPHCGKTNKVGRAQLMRAAPDWVKKETEAGTEPDSGNSYARNPCFSHPRAAESRPGAGKVHRR